MNRRHHKRLILVVAGIFVLATGIAARLYDLQVLRCDGLRQRAESQHKRRIEVSATRGAILDRHGRELAVSLATQSLYAHPRHVDDPERAADLLAPVVDRPRHELLSLLRSDKSFVWIHRFLEPDRAEAVRSLDLPVDNLQFGFLPSYKRYYPHGKLGIHVVGLTDIDGVGIEGIERRMNEELRGDLSVYLVLQNGRSGGLREMVGAPETEPHDVVLTLDLVLQRLAERELDRAIEESGAKAATAILMEPATGRILALANRPAADGNRFGDAPEAARVNRGVIYQFEPGSTFKIVSMAAALERREVRPDQRFFCENGVYTTGGRTIRDVSPQGMLTASQVMAKSSNICMSKIVERLEPEEFADVIRRFGFGSPTGVELPGEARGAVPATSEWSAYTRSSLSFGQEIGVTALQLATAVAVVANDGIRVPPRVLLGTVDPQGGFHRAAAPQASRVISERTARELSAMLEGVIAHGTGKNAAIPGYRLAGKSGTAQKAIPGGYSETDYMPSFGGFGPVISPRLVALVVLDSPSYGKHRGGRSAAPVFRRIMTDALAYLRVPADEEPLSVTRRAAARADEARAAVHTPARAQLPPDSVREGRVPELRGLTLREAVVDLASHGYLTESEGRGAVVAQYPPAGTELARGEFCRLRLKDRND
jgi:cell division protein FtsI (penicillin-binding protein 3)